MADRVIGHAEMSRDDSPVRIPGTKAVNYLPEIREARETICWFKLRVPGCITKGFKADPEESFS